MGTASARSRDCQVNSLGKLRDYVYMRLKQIWSKLRTTWRVPQVYVDRQQLKAGFAKQARRPGACTRKVAAQGAGRLIGGSHVNLAEFNRQPDKQLQLEHPERHPDQVFT